MGAQRVEFGSRWGMLEIVMIWVQHRRKHNNGGSMDTEQVPVQPDSPADTEQHPQDGEKRSIAPTTYTKEQVNAIVRERLARFKTDTIEGVVQERMAEQNKRYESVAEQLADARREAAIAKAALEHNLSLDAFDGAKDEAHVALIVGAIETDRKRRGVGVSVDAGIRAGSGTSWRSGIVSQIAGGR